MLRLIISKFQENAFKNEDFSKFELVIERTADSD